MDHPEIPFITVKSLSWGNYEDTAALASLFFEVPGHPQSFGPLTHIVCSDLVGIRDYPLLLSS